MNGFLENLELINDDALTIQLIFHYRLPNIEERAKGLPFEDLRG